MGRGEVICGERGFLSEEGRLGALVGELEGFEELWTISRLALKKKQIKFDAT